MTIICKKKECTGCTACMNVCHHHAIIMESDACGFFYPAINQEICVDCGLCKKICPANNPLMLETIKDCYAVTVKEEKDLLSCSSGGAATAMSRSVVEKKGIVYGCTGEDSRFVHHIRVSIKEDIEILKGSKYVQSWLGDVFKQVKDDLKNYHLVLFIGTPCQVAGLKSYLRRDYQNLITVDLVCHGVPSQKMLNDNINQSCSENEKVTIAFRRKNTKSKIPQIEYGWKMTAAYGYESDFKPYNKDFYMFGFLRGLILRENCYNCRYAQNNRVGDLTLCDFWGLKPDAKLELGKGVSAVLVNTEKGKQFFCFFKDKINYKKRDVLEATRWNEHLNHPCNIPKNYLYFTKLYINHSFRKAMVKAYIGEYVYDYYIHYKNLLKLFLNKHKIISKL